MTVFSCYIGTTWICDQKLDKDGDGNFVFNPQIHSILWEMESIFSAIQNYLATFSISKDKQTLSSVVEEKSYDNKRTHFDKCIYNLHI